MELPKPLRLASIMEMDGDGVEKAAAAELRRLYAEVEALRAALAQPQAEPDALLVLGDGDEMRAFLTQYEVDRWIAQQRKYGSPYTFTTVPLYRAAPACEPCGTVNCSEHGVPIPAAAPAQADTVRIPTDADEAAAMVLVGTAWLKEHAPDRLKAPAQAERRPIPTAEMVRLIEEVRHGSTSLAGFARVFRAAEKAHGITGEQP
jgi:hypothetical protein